MRVRTAELLRPLKPLRPLRLAQRSRSGLGLGALRLVAVPFGMLTQVVVSRAAGSVAMGEYAVMLSIVGVLAAVMNAGIPTYAARELPRLPVTRHHEAARQSLAISVALVVVVGVVWAVAGTAVARWVKIDTSFTVVAVIWLCSAAVAVLTLAGGLARGSGAFRLATVAESSWTSIIVGTAVAAVAVIGQLHSARMVLVLRTAVVAAGAAWLVVRWWRMTSRHSRLVEPMAADTPAEDEVDDGHPLALGPPVATARGPLLALSLVILAATVANWVQGQLPLWRLSSSGDVAGRAEFVAVSRMAQLAALPGAVALMMSSPALARRGGGGEIDEDHLRWRVTQSTGAVLTYGVFVVAASAWLLDHVWNLRHADATLVAAVLLAGHLVHTATGPCGYALIMADRERYALGSAIVGALAGLATAALTGAEAGAVTAALTVTVAMMVTNALNLVLCTRMLGLRTWVTLRR